MGCRIIHWWKHLDREKIHHYYQDTYACRRCAATKTEYQRQGEEGMQLDFNILQVAMFCIMSWLLLIRLCAYMDSQATTVRETTPLDYYDPYYGN